MKISTRTLVQTALLSALIFVLTALVRIPIPATSGGGYVNIGDSVIATGALIFGGTPAAFAAAFGSTLADVASGAAIYALPTFIIKGSMGLVIVTFARKRRFWPYVIGVTIAELIMIAGYAAFESFAYRPEAALAALPFNAFQALFNLILALLLYRPTISLVDAIISWSNR